jgi:hypothetical protein
MEAARTSETSVDNYFTRQYIPEHKSELHTRRRKNLKSHMLNVINAYRLGIYRVVQNTVLMVKFNCSTDLNEIYFSCSEHNSVLGKRLIPFAVSFKSI